MLEYREFKKLHSTYVEGLSKLIDGNGLVHTSFNQAVAETGRLSSTAPNLQNMPVRTERGRSLRKVFVPSGPDRVLMAADYSQIELRVLAHNSQDPILIDAFKNDRDIHNETAARVFQVLPDLVTKDMRRKAKEINFSIVYGISDFGLAGRMGISRQVAREFIDMYYATYKGVADYLEFVEKFVLEKGWVATLAGRKRYFREYRTTNRNLRQHIVRSAINTPMQGGAADIIKLAMIKIDSELARSSIDAKMVLQVHDELLFDIRREHLDQAIELIGPLMTDAVRLYVPLKVEIEIGDNWLEMSGHKSVESNAILDSSQAASFELNLSGGMPGAIFDIGT